MQPASKQRSDLSVRLLRFGAAFVELRQANLVEAATQSCDGLRIAGDGRGIALQVGDVAVLDREQWQRQ